MSFFGVVLVVAALTAVIADRPNFLRGKNLDSQLVQVLKEHGASLDFSTTTTTANENRELSLNWLVQPFCGMLTDELPVSDCSCGVDLANRGFTYTCSIESLRCIFGIYCPTDEYTGTVRFPPDALLDFDQVIVTSTISFSILGGDLKVTGEHCADDAGSFCSCRVTLNGKECGCTVEGCTGLQVQSDCSDVNAAIHLLTPRCIGGEGK